MTSKSLQACDDISSFFFICISGNRNSVSGFILHFLNNGQVLTMILFSIQKVLLIHASTSLSLIELNGGFQIVILMTELLTKLSS
jgi:hypothetical protein